jgi:hypothetical protein
MSSPSVISSFERVLKSFLEKEGIFNEFLRFMNDTKCRRHFLPILLAKDATDIGLEVNRRLDSVAAGINPESVYPWTNAEKQTKM